MSDRIINYNLKCIADNFDLILRCLIKNSGPFNCCSFIIVMVVQLSYYSNITAIVIASITAINVHAAGLRLLIQLHL